MLTLYSIRFSFFLTKLLGRVPTCCPSWPLSLQVHQLHVDAQPKELAATNGKMLALMLHPSSSYVALEADTATVATDAMEVRACPGLDHICLQDSVAAYCFWCI